MSSDPAVLEIGQHAGVVWKELSAKGALTVAALKKAKNLGEAEVQRAIGWLAREDKIRFEQKGRTVVIVLK